MAKLSNLANTALEVLVDIARAIGANQLTHNEDSRDDWRLMCQWADEFQAEFDTKPDAAETYIEDVEVFAIQKATQAGWTACKAHGSEATQASLDLGDESQAQSDKPTALAEGETRWIGNWQIRNFKGYYQSREGGAGPWKFHVSGFDATTTGQHGSCSLILAGGGREAVPIDAKDRISVLGVKYNRNHWVH